MPRSVAGVDRLSLSSSRFRLCKKTTPRFRGHRFYFGRRFLVWVGSVARRTGVFPAANSRGEHRHGERGIGAFPAVLLFRPGVLLRPGALEFFFLADRFFYLSPAPDIVRGLSFF